MDESAEVDEMTGALTVRLGPVTHAGAGFSGVSASPPSVRRLDQAGRLDESPERDEMTGALALVLREAGFGDTEISEIGNATREATTLTPRSVAKEGQASR